MLGKTATFSNSTHIGIKNGVPLLLMPVHIWYVYTMTHFDALIALSCYKLNYVASYKVQVIAK